MIIHSLNIGLPHYILSGELEERGLLAIYLPASAWSIS
jgi:hypothetical protein